MKKQDIPADEINREDGPCCMDAISSGGERDSAERVGSDGNVWRKVYTGGGAHLNNWLDQFIELWGEENVQTEELDPAGLCCYREGGEKLFQVWVRQGGSENMPGTENRCQGPARKAF